MATSALAVTVACMLRATFTGTQPWGARLAAARAERGGTFQAVPVRARIRRACSTSGEASIFCMTTILRKDRAPDNEGMRVS